MFSLDIYRLFLSNLVIVTVKKLNRIGIIFVKFRLCKSGLIDLLFL